MEVILIIILILWLLPKVLRWWLGRWVARRMAPPAEKRRKEGEVTVENCPPPQKKVARDVGDYVEFEEVEE